MKMNEQMVTALIEKHAAELLVRILQQARSASQAHAANVQEMRASAISHGREPQQPYDELDYRTCELLEREARRIAEDSWMSIDAAERGERY